MAQTMAFEGDATSSHYHLENDGNRERRGDAATCQELAEIVRYYGR